MRLVAVHKSSVALVRYLLEAHEGLGFMYGDGTEQIALFAPDSQLAALEELIDDLAAAGLLERAGDAASPVYSRN
jgi:hypothetical protein